MQSHLKLLDFWVQFVVHRLNIGLRLPKPFLERNHHVLSGNNDLLDLFFLIFLQRLLCFFLRFLSLNEQTERFKDIFKVLFANRMLLLFILQHLRLLFNLFKNFFLFWNVAFLELLVAFGHILLLSLPGVHLVLLIVHVRVQLGFHDPLFVVKLCLFVLQRVYLVFQREVLDLHRALEVQIIHRNALLVLLGLGLEFGGWSFWQLSLGSRTLSGRLLLGYVWRHDLSILLIWHAAWSEGETGHSELLH